MIEEKLDKIKLFAMDVDGTLTDGSIYISEQGEAMKRFDVKDGLGISLLNNAGITTVIVTGRISQIVRNRAAELKISEVMQGIHQKDLALEELAQRYELTPDEIAYIGDDLNDLPALKCAGLAVCPADACEEVKDCCDIVLKNNGGQGAVREFAKLLLKQQKTYDNVICNLYHLKQ